MKLWSMTEVGGHAVNEDAFLVQPHLADDACWLAVLADGQGGQAGGRQAAQLACQTALAAALIRSPGELNDGETWSNLLRQADDAVARDRDAGYTTLIGLCVRNGAVCGAACGDSAVLAVHHEGQALDLTRHQFKNPPVGSGHAVFVPFATKLVGPWVVLVMSDGVWKYVGWEWILERASRLQGQELVDTLAGLARLPGSGKFQDDFTLLALQDD